MNRWCSSAMASMAARYSAAHAGGPSAPHAVMVFRCRPSLRARSDCFHPMLRRVLRNSSGFIAGLARA